MDILGEKWTLLIVREIICGSSRFNELQRGLGQISPTVLTKRLAYMVDQGLLFKKHIPGQRGHEYFATKACQDLFPVIEQVGQWGMKWARHQMTADDFDLQLLMLHLERYIQPNNLIGHETVIRFNFSDVIDYSTWWVVVTGQDVDVCVNDPGKEVDVYFNVCVKTMCELWMGDISYKRAIADGNLQLIGPKALINNVEDWLKPNLFAGLQPANEIVEPA